MTIRQSILCAALFTGALAGAAHAADKPAPPAPPIKASFDCAKAKGRIQTLICGDADLATLDVQEDQLLRRARIKSAQPEAVGAEEDQWRSERDGCSSAACIARAYRRRLVDLHRWTN